MTQSEFLIRTGMVWPVSSDKWEAPFKIGLLQFQSAKKWLQCLLKHSTENSRLIRNFIIFHACFFACVIFRPSNKSHIKRYNWRVVISWGIEAMYERPRVNVNVERGSTFTFTRDLLYIVSVLFTRTKIYVRTHVKITRQ